MTPAQATLVQTSFARVLPIADAAAAMFYTRLFAMAPELRSLFRGNMAAQGAKLIATLKVAVDALDHIETILPAVRALATRHVAYGVKPEHYAPVGAALLWTLERGLGAAFTPEVQAAWIGAYRTLSEVMIEAAYGSTRLAS